jgi:predicted GH43/DUF377 family glycosyl hydrolase
MKALKLSALVSRRIVPSVWLAVMFSVALHAQPPMDADSLAPPLDFSHMMQPIPESAAFRDPGYFVWGGSIIRGKDSKYHLYYTRWKTADGFNAWDVAPEIAHSVGDSPSGPFVFHDVALPARGKQFWDGMATYNPTIHRFGNKYYLYYAGNFGDGVIMPIVNPVHRNNQRIGVAVSTNPNGPWKRFDRPIIDISTDPNASDTRCVANPSVTRGGDGKYHLLYKAIPWHGPVVHMLAVSDSPTGPFQKISKPLFTIPGAAFPFEDPYFWFDAKRNMYFVIMRDMQGRVSGNGHSSLVLFESKDALDWKTSDHPLVSNLELHWKDRPMETVKRMERPQLLFDPKGNPIVLAVAIMDGGKETYNVRIPLSVNGQ